MPELLIFPVELRRFFEEPRNAAILPLAILVPLISLWPYFATPLVPALCAALACIEPCALNMWSLWPRQIDGLAVRPIDWRRVIAVKNLVTMLLLVGLFVTFTIITYFFHTGRIPAGHLVAGLLHCMIGGMGLIIVGNNYSVVNPRAKIGWTLTDVGAAVLAVLIGGASIVPALLASLLVGTIPGCVLVMALLAAVWVARSLPHTALRLSTHIPDLWMNTQS